MEAWLIRLYAAFFDGFDPLGLWRHNVVDREAGQTLHNADLSSIRELSLIHAFAPTRDQAVTAVVEVGGGYGRLAEAALNVFGLPGNVSDPGRSLFRIVRLGPAT